MDKAGERGRQKVERENQSPYLRRPLASTTSRQLSAQAENKYRRGDENVLCLSSFVVDGAHSSACWVPLIPPPFLDCCTVSYLSVFIRRRLTLRGPV